MNREESIKHFESQQKRYMREHGGKPCPHYNDAIKSLRQSEIVRCENCQMWQSEYKEGKESLGNVSAPCEYWSNDDGYVRYTRPIDYCSYGEKETHA